MSDYPAEWTDLSRVLRAMAAYGEQARALHRQLDDLSALMAVAQAEPGTVTLRARALSLAELAA